MHRPRFLPAFLNLALAMKDLPLFRRQVSTPLSSQASRQVQINAVTAGQIILSVVHNSRHEIVCMYVNEK